MEAVEANVSSVSFGHDGRTLVVTGDNPDVLVYDLEYYARHIAGNWEYQASRLKPELGDAIQTERLQEWTEAVLSRPWPRLSWSDE